MKKRLAITIGIALGVTVGIWFNPRIVGATEVEPLAAWRHETCRFQSANPHRHWTRWEVRATIGCAEDHWPTDRAKVFYIAQRESGLFAGARNPSSGACGLFQFYPAATFGSYWHGWARLNGVRAGRSCFNARSNALAAVHFMHNLGFDPWS